MVKMLASRPTMHGLEATNRAGLTEEDYVTEFDLNLIKDTDIPRDFSMGQRRLIHITEGSLSHHQLQNAPPRSSMLVNARELHAHLQNSNSEQNILNHGPSQQQHSDSLPIYPGIPNGNNRHHLMPVKLASPGSPPGSSRDDYSPTGPLPSSPDFGTVPNSHDQDPLSPEHHHPRNGHGHPGHIMEEVTPIWNNGGMLPHCRTTRYPEHIDLAGQCPEGMDHMWYRNKHEYTASLGDMDSPTQHDGHNYGGRGPHSIDGRQSYTRLDNQLDIPDDDLITLAVRDLNKKLHGRPRDVIIQYKMKRRTLKNRGYAQNCRQKRTEHKQKLEKTTEAQEQIIKQLTVENARFRDEVNRLVSQLSRVENEFQNAKAQLAAYEYDKAVNQGIQNAAAAVGKHGGQQQQQGQPRCKLHSPYNYDNRGEAKAAIHPGSMCPMKLEQQHRAQQQQQFNNGNPANGPNMNMSPRVNGGGGGGSATPAHQQDRSDGSMNSSMSSRTTTSNPSSPEQQYNNNY